MLMADANHTVAPKEQPNSAAQQPQSAGIAYRAEQAAAKGFKMDMNSIQADFDGMAKAFHEMSGIGLEGKVRLISATELRSLDHQGLLNLQAETKGKYHIVLKDEVYKAYYEAYQAVAADKSTTADDLSETSSSIRAEYVRGLATALIDLATKIQNVGGRANPYNSMGPEIMNFFTSRANPEQPQEIQLAKSFGAMLGEVYKRALVDILTATTISDGQQVSGPFDDKSVLSRLAAQGKDTQESVLAFMQENTFSDLVRRGVQMAHPHVQEHSFIWNKVASSYFTSQKENLETILTGINLVVAMEAARMNITPESMQSGEALALQGSSTTLLQLESVLLAEAIASKRQNLKAVLKDPMSLVNQYGESKRLPPDSMYQ